MTSEKYIKLSDALELVNQYEDYFEGDFEFEDFKKELKQLADQSQETLYNKSDNKEVRLEPQSNEGDVSSPDTNNQNVCKNCGHEYFYHEEDEGCWDNFVLEKGFCDCNKFEPKGDKQ